MNKKGRLNEIIKHYSDGKPSVFAKFLGVAPSTISSWLSRDTFDYDLIFAKCENISSDWLLTGEGSMLLSDNQEKTTKTAHKKDCATVEHRLLDIIQEKDCIIREQAEEIGRLKERIAQLEREKGKDASDARTSGVANVG